MGSITGLGANCFIQCITIDLLGHVGPAVLALLMVGHALQSSSIYAPIGCALREFTALHVCIEYSACGVLAGRPACRARERVPPRQNYDKTTNRNGSQLLLFCCTLELYIVNGRLRGDYGRYTYSSSLGSCTVDYFITELNPQSVSVHLAVGSLNSIFDLSANILSRNPKKINSDEKWFSLRLKQYRNTLRKKTRNSMQVNSSM